MLLKRSLDSVLKQSFEDFLVWVVDDGSTDGTTEWLKTITDTRLRVIELHRNLGVSSARNAGIRAGQAPFVALLDSDDEWKPRKLEKQIQQLQSHPQFALSHTEETWWRNEAEVRIPKKYQKSGGWIFDRCVEVCCISPSTTVLRRSILEELGLFREDFIVCEDYELWLRISNRYEVGFVSEPLIIKHGGHSDQLSMQYKAMDYWRVKALQSFKDNPAARESILRRGHMLLKGYQKYGRTDSEVREVQNWIKILETSASSKSTVRTSEYVHDRISDPT